MADKATRRDPAAVIERVLFLVPPGELKLRALLTSLREDIEFLPPEGRYLAWSRLGEILGRHISVPPVLDWEVLISQVVRGQPEQLIFPDQAVIQERSEELARAFASAGVKPSYDRWMEDGTRTYFFAEPNSSDDRFVSIRVFADNHLIVIRCGAGSSFGYMIEASRVADVVARKLDELGWSERQS